MHRVAVLLALVVSVHAAPSAKNVVLIVVDDLRPQLSVYGKETMHTPHVDALAASAGALVFDNAFTQQAICNPSRSSFLTSRRPETTRVWDLKQYWRTSGGNFTSLPEAFRVAGFNTAGGGKVFHPCPGCNDDRPYSWTYPYFHASKNATRAYSNFTHCFAQVADDVPLTDLPDGQIAANAVSQLRSLAASDDPFMLAVGFHRPHLPFVAPKRFFGLYPRDNISLAAHPYPPDNWGDARRWAWDPQSGPRHMADIAAMNLSLPYGLIPNDTAIAMRQAYFACVSFIDELVGQVLGNLTALGLDDTTAVALVGDHGWHLSDNGEFGKKTNFDVAVRAPLIVRLPPSTTTAAGAALHPTVATPGVVARTSALVEFVDIMPTLMEAAGLPVPPLCPPDSRNVSLCTEGFSMTPLLADPDAPWKTAAWTWYPASRYTEWVDFNKTTVTPEWSRLLARELYDHTTDPGENVNQAANPAYSHVVQQLSAMLHAGWRHTAPPTTAP